MKSTAVPPSDSTDIAAPPAELIAAFATGNAVLFVGAGLSIGAGLPSWSELVSALSAETGYQGKDPLKAAQYYVDRHPNRAILVKHLRERLDTTGIEPTACHSLLTQLPARIVCTTNFDNLLERAYQAAGHEVNLVVTASDLHKWDETKVNVIKLHGTLDSPDSIVITETDYDNYPKTHGWCVTQLASLLATKTFLFVGYRMSDVDLRQVQSHVALVVGAQRRPYYLVTFGLCGLELKSLEQKGCHVTNLPSKGNRNDHLYTWLRQMSQEVQKSRPPRVETMATASTCREAHEPSEHSRKVPGRTDGGGGEIGALSGLESLSRETVSRAGYASSVQISMVPSSVHDAVPLRPIVLTPRNDLVREVLSHMESATWVAICGGPGTGKTQIARAVLEVASARQSWWVSLRNLDQDRGEAHLADQLALWFGKVCAQCGAPPRGDAPRDASVWLVHHLARMLGSEMLLILDDLPDPSKCAGVHDTIAGIASVLQPYGAHMLSTCQHRLPPVCDTEPQLVTQMSMPTLTNIEVVEMLQGAGAPPEVATMRRGEMIVALTRGHPALASATIAWLRDRRWAMGRAELSALFARESTEDVQRYYRRQLIRMVGADARDFLYRLSVVDHDFSRQLALEIGDISPSINRPGELLDDVTGPWVQPLQATLFEVTPLLSGVGAENLDSQLVREIHAHVAGFLTSGKTVSASVAHRVVAHLLAARLYQRLTVFLVQLLLSARTTAQAQSVRWATMVLGAGADWPAEVPLGLRIMLRAAQVRATALAGDNFTRLDQDLVVLMSQAGDGELNALIFANGNAGVLCPGMLPQVAVSRTFALARLAKSAHPDLYGMLHTHRADMIWAAAATASTRDDVLFFLERLDGLEDDERKQVMSSELSVESTACLIEQIWLSEFLKPIEKRRWKEVLDTLGSIERMLCYTEAPFIAAVARCKALVWAEQLHEVDKALEIMQNLPASSCSDLVFLANYTMGCILFDARRMEQAAEHLAPQACADGKRFTYYRFDSVRRTALANASLLKYPEAIRGCLSALRFASTDDSIPTYDRLEILGELAWDWWATGARRKCASAMYGLVKALSKHADIASPRFREVFNKVSHALGWFVSHALTGDPPRLPQSEYVPVEAGFFGLRRERLAEYQPPFGFSMPRLLTMTGTLAALLNLPGIACQAYDQACVIAGGVCATGMMGLELMQYASASARLGRIEASLRIGVTAMKALAAEEGGTGKATSHVSWEDLPKEKRAATERGLFGYVFAPAFAESFRTRQPREAPIAQASLLGYAMRGLAKDAEDSAFWEQVACAVETLGEVACLRQVLQQELSIAHSDQYLWSLSLVIRSTQPHLKLIDSLSLQAASVTFLVNPNHLCQHLLPGIADMLHRFWSNIACTRGFALSGPQLFRQRLEVARSASPVIAAIEVIESAAVALRAVLPNEAKQVFRTARSLG